MIANNRGEKFDDVIAAYRGRNSGISDPEKSKSFLSPIFVGGTLLGLVVAYIIYKKYEEMKSKKSSGSTRSPNTLSGTDTPDSGS
jgi:hypothetical protein